MKLNFKSVALLALALPVLALAQEDPPPNPQWQLTSRVILGPNEDGELLIILTNFQYSSETMYYYGDVENWYKVTGATTNAPSWSGLFSSLVINEWTQNYPSTPTTVAARTNKKVFAYVESTTGYEKHSYVPSPPPATTAQRDLDMKISGDVYFEVIELD